MMFLKNFNRLLEGEPDATGGTGGTLDITGGAAPAAAEPVPAGEAAGWLEGVDEEFAKDPSLASIQDLNGLAKSYIHAQKMIGKDKIVIPDEYASEEDMNAFYAKLGRPERDKYEVQFGETEYDDDFKKNFMDMAHTQGLLPKQAAEMFKFWDEQISEASSAFDTESAEGTVQKLNDLKSEWGTGYEKHVEVAKTAVDTLISPEAKEYLRTSGLGSDPEMIKMFAQIGSKLNEDTFSRDTVKHMGITKDEAQDKADAMNGNMGHPYWDATHTGHDKAVKDMAKYNEILAS